jgi:hypothetical protein
MKKKLRKNMKLRSLFKVVFYTAEMGTNFSCKVNTGCNAAVNC